MLDYTEEARIVGNQLWGCQEAISRQQKTGAKPQRPRMLAHAQWAALVEVLSMLKPIFDNNNIELDLSDVVEEMTGLPELEDYYIAPEIDTPESEVECQPNQT